MSMTIHIFLKEAREMLRDKRVRSGAIIMPIVMMMMFMFLFGFLTDTLSKPSNVKVSVIGGGPLVEALKAAKMQVTELKSVSEAEAKIRKGDVRVALEMPLDAPQAGKQVVIRAYFDPKDDKAKVNLSQIEALFSAASQKALETLIVAKGLPREASEPIKMEERPVKVGEEAGASEIVISLLPYLIVVYAFYGGMGAVSDLMAGEKEKMTLETLLITPVSRREITVGKFMALGALCLTSALSAFVGLMLSGMLKLQIFSKLFPNGTGVTPAAFAVTLAALIPAVALFAALMLAISTKSKNMREAQTHLALLSIVVLLPAMFSQFLGLTDFAKAGWINAVPVLNTATAIRSALQGKTDLPGLGIAIAVDAAIAAVAIWWAIKLMEREEVLVRV